MNKRHLFFAALFLAALAFGFVGCENPDDDLLNNSGNDTSITDGDSITDGNTKPATPEVPTMVATGGASDVEYSTITLWGRINTDTLWAFQNIKWGIECSTSKEEMQSHKGKKALCTTDLVGENSDEYTVAFTEVGYGKILYYNAYLLINNMKYIYGEVDSVQMLVRLTANPNNNEYGTVSGSGNYELGSEVTITATPKENYSLEGWSDCDSKELVRTVKLTSPDTTIVANFKLYPRLTVQANNADYGTVTGSGLYEKGTEVSITATPKGNYYFASWSDGNTDNPRIVVVSSDTTFTANFAKKPYLTVNVNSDTNGGKVSGSGYYDIGAEATITATPNRGFYFVKWNDGNTDNPRTVTINEDITYTATFAANPNGTENGYEWVDLGLSVKWATCNVGATTPEGYGDYFAWGETTTKAEYTSENYAYTENSEILPLSNDAVVVNMGGEWRMPTIEEQKELINECTWRWTTQNSVKGYLVTSKTNGNSIFLPAAGCRSNSGLYDAGSYGYYWSSSLITGDSRIAYNLYFYLGRVGWSYYNRCCGRSVRGVCP